MASPKILLATITPVKQIVQTLTIGPLTNPPTSAPRLVLIASRPKILPRSAGEANNPARIVMVVKPTPTKNQAIAVRIVNCQKAVACPISQVVGILSSPANRINALRR
jgi:hypothetical protein